MFIVRIIRDIARLASILDARSIARRMFVTNSIDGLLSSIGVVLGAYVAGARNPLAYIGAVAGAAFSMGFFSGIIGTYLSERAERLRELHHTERVLLHGLRGSIYERAAKLVPVYVALWSGTGAILLPLVMLAPFYIAIAVGSSTVGPEVVYASTGIGLLELFILGCYLGKIAGESPLLSGLRMACLGLLATLVFLAIELLT